MPEIGGEFGQTGFAARIHFLHDLGDVLAAAF